MSTHTDMGPALADLPLSLATLRRPEMQENPYPFYQRLRCEDPVHWEESRHIWALTRYDDISTVLKDPRLSAHRDWERTTLVFLPAEAHETAHDVFRAYDRMVLFSDPPDHTRLRRLMLSAFTPRVVEGMRPLIQSLVDRMLDAAEQRGRMDIIADLAYPLPTAVIAALLGVPENDRDQFKRWSNDLATSFDTDPARPQRTVAAYDGVLALLDYMAELVSRRRQEPHDDLTQALIAASDTEGGLSAEAVVANTALLLFAGHETTTNLIGNGMHALLHHPDQLQRLLADPELIASAVEELLRFDSPVQGTGRQAKEDLDIGGRRIGAGQMLLLYIGAANRDPAQFDDPDRLDLARAENRHLTFSYGPHFCLGAALARLEGQIAVGTLLRRWPGLRLTSESARWRDNFLLRGLMELPVVF